MTTTYLEYLHISQFYETIFLLILVIPMIMQVLLLRNQLWIYINLKRIDEGEEHARWVEQNGGEGEDSEIQRHITEIEQDSRREGDQVATEQQEEQQKQEQEQNNLEENEPQPPPYSTPFPPPIPRPTSANPQQPLPPSPHQKPEPTSSQQRTLYFYSQTLDVYEQYLPLIISVVTLSILTFNCEVFSLAMFFCYIIATFLLDYAEMFQKLKKEYQSERVAPYVGLVSGGFMGAIFVNLMAREEYGLV